MTKKQNIFYGVIGGITLALVLPFSIWSLTDSKTSGNALVKQAILEVDPSARKEYIVGEDFSTKGLKFFLNKDKEIDMESLTVKYDFSTAGKKVVNISYLQSGITYSAKHYVDVYSATNLDVRGYENMYIDTEGNVVAPSIKVIANLSGPANEFEKDERYPDFDKCCFVLGKEQYKISANLSADFDNYYNVTLFAGGCTYGWVYSAVEDHPDVASTDRMYRFSNETDNNKELTLFVTSNSNGYIGIGPGINTEVNGVYILKDLVANTRKEYKFKYRIETYSSQFLSSSFGEGLVDSQVYKEDNDAMKVQVEGDTYYAAGGSWHKAILGA